MGERREMRRTVPGRDRVETAPDGDAEGTEAVLVLKLDHNPFHHGALGIVRSLGRAGIPVYAVVEDRGSPIGWSRFLTGAFLWNPDPTDTDALVEGLRRIGRTIGGRPVVIPVDDFGAILLAEHAAELRPFFRFPDVAPELPGRLASKSGLAAICRNVGVSTPEVTEFRSPADIRSVASTVSYPVAVKVVQPWLPGSRKSRSTAIVSTAAELHALAGELEAAGGPAVLIQEYLPGDQCEDWFVHACVGEADDGSPAFRLSVTGRKLRAYPADAGLTSFGRAWDNPELRSIAERFLTKVGYRGIADLDFRMDRRNGTYYLIDANPRVGAQFAIARRSDDKDAAQALYRELTGEPLAAQRAQRADHAFCVENYDVLTVVRSLIRRRLTIREWLHSLRAGPVEWAWIAVDDIRPWALMWARCAVRVVTRRRSPRAPVHRFPIPWRHGSRGVLPTGSPTNPFGAEPRTRASV